MKQFTLFLTFFLLPYSFVSAQEIIVPATYDAWLSSLAGRGTLFQLGLSAENRPIPGITIGNADAREQVVLVGRQHPPEVTGALAAKAIRT